VNVGHESLSIVLALLKSVRARGLVPLLHTIPEAAALYERGLRVEGELRRAPPRGPLIGEPGRPRLVDLAFCELCGSYHEEPHAL
jgi:hypothetical protein